jgi:hypothetical protein
MATLTVLTKKSHQACISRGKVPHRAYIVRCNAGLHGAHLFPISKYPLAHLLHEIPVSHDRVKRRQHAAKNRCSKNWERPA